MTIIFPREASSNPFLNPSSLTAASDTFFLSSLGNWELERGASDFISHVHKVQRRLICFRGEGSATERMTFFPLLSRSKKARISQLGPITECRRRNVTSLKRPVLERKGACVSFRQSPLWKVSSSSRQPLLSSLSFLLSGSALIRKPPPPPPRRRRLPLLQPVCLQRREGEGEGMKGKADCWSG